MTELYAVSLGLGLSASTLAVPIQAGQVTWPSIVDVVTALAIVLLGMVSYTRGQRVVDERAPRRSYVIATTVIVAVLVAMRLAVGRLHFNVLLTGRAWRRFVLLQSLPAALPL